MINSLTIKLIRSTSSSIRSRYSWFPVWRCLNSWTKPRSVVRGLRISWATPAASWPITDSFSERRSSSSVSLRSVILRLMAANATISPSSSSTGDRVRLT
ncbi:hypothetical protein D3C81_1971390 [compost metagenome]